jgi:hypothetical protein
MAPRRAILVLLLGSSWSITACGCARAQDEQRPPTSLYDPRLGETRRAAIQWERHRGPTRKVVDQVVLVPDLPAFFEAIAAWDDLNYFPVLIDDGELAPKFIRAFKPARVLRFPGRPKAIEANVLWSEAVRAVGRGWGRDMPGPPEPPPVLVASRPGATPMNRILDDNGPRGDIAPVWLGPTPPGVVVSNSASTSLAGAVALAAGRFQPLILLETDAKKTTTLDGAAAQKLARALEAAVAEVVPRYSALGDQCDFLTIAGPYPDRFALGGSGLKAGIASFDDLIGRDFESLRRWAYVGRLGGNSSESAYRAMCSLFLQPQSALLFDGYDENDKDFRPFAMRVAVPRLPREMAITLVNGPKADLAGWHRQEDPINEFGLVYVNTHGNPTNFNLAASSLAVTADIPPSVPSIVIYNHSFSAADPDNPETLAGAWLSGGAYLYFGSLNEPYIQSFRTPGLVASLLHEGIPIGAALRMGPDENPAFGTPWRLHLLGDPLFRIDFREARAPRWPSLDVSETWPPYLDEPAPPANASDAVKLAWAAKMTFFDAAKGDTFPIRPALENALTTIRRDTLPTNLRPILDDLRIDAMPRSKARGDDLLAALAAVPAAEAAPNVVRAVLHARLMRLRRAAEKGDWNTAATLWETIERSPAPLEVKQSTVKAVGGLASRGSHVINWRLRLRSVLEGREPSAENKHLREEQARVQGAPAKPAPTEKPGMSIRRGG